MSLYCVPCIVTLCATLWTVTPRGPSVNEILQVRTLEWVAIPSSRESSWLTQGWTCVSCIAGRFFKAEPPGKPLCINKLALFKKYHTDHI